jgi:hypothetical protein
VTQLKIDLNPFAKGFRDTGAGRREKKRHLFHSHSQAQQLLRNSGGCSVTGLLPSAALSSSKSLAGTAAIKESESAGDESPESESDDSDSDYEGTASKRPRTIDSDKGIYIYIYNHIKYYIIYIISNIILLCVSKLE